MNPHKAPSASLGDYEHHDPPDLTFGEFEEIRKAGKAVLVDVRNPGSFWQKLGCVNAPAGPKRILRRKFLFVQYIACDQRILKSQAFLCFSTTTTNSSWRNHEFFQKLLEFFQKKFLSFPYKMSSSRLIWLDELKSKGTIPGGVNVPTPEFAMAFTALNPTDFEEQYGFAR